MEDFIVGIPGIKSTSQLEPLKEFVCPESLGLSIVALLPVDNNGVCGQESSLLNLNQVYEIKNSYDNFSIYYKRAPVKELYSSLKEDTVFMNWGMQPKFIYIDQFDISENIISSLSHDIKNKIIIKFSKGFMVVNSKEYIINYMTEMTCSNILAFSFDWGDKAKDLLQVNTSRTMVNLMIHDVEKKNLPDIGRHFYKIKGIISSELSNRRVTSFLEEVRDQYELSLAC